MGVIASQITSLTIVYTTVYSDTDQIKHQSSASLAFVRGIHRGLVNSPHKWPVTQNMFPFDDIIMKTVSVDSLVPRLLQTQWWSCSVVYVCNFMTDIEWVIIWKIIIHSDIWDSFKIDNLVLCPMQWLQYSYWDNAISTCSKVNNLKMSWNLYQCIPQIYYSLTITLIWLNK